jgi:hyperosmotically inducible periplasmic protein
MNIRIKSVVVAMLTTASLGLIACEQRSASDASRKVEQAAQNAAATTSAAVDKAVAATDDAAITAKIKAAILAEPGLKSLQINVDTKDGTVALSGTVGNVELRERAKPLASSTSGVKGVVDQLTVKVS